jgi:prepilin-type processing-associated H-X9-DG protein
LYADDNNGAIPPCPGGTTAETPNLSWCAGDFSTTPADRTDLTLLKNSLLGTYAVNTGVYKCPGDITANVRSYCENCAMNGNDTDLMANYVFFRKVSAVPSSTRYFVFIDESSDTIDNAHFLINFDKSYSGAVADHPAVYHNRSGNLSYVDGHVASHRWQANPVTDINPDGIWLMQHGSLPLDGSGWPAPVLE